MLDFSRVFGRMIVVIVKKDRSRGIFMRKIGSALILTATLLVSSVFTSLPAKADGVIVDDITGIALEAEMRKMIELGVVQGFSEDVYKPKNNVTRGEFATFVSRALQLPAGDKGFPDVDPSSKLEYGISSANKAGIVTGYSDGRFGPNDKITREQMAVMMERALIYLKLTPTQASIQFTDENKFNSSYTKRAIATIVHYEITNGIPNGDSTSRFDPQQYAKRDEAAAMISRLLNAAKLEPDPITYYNVSTIQNGQIVQGSKTYYSYDSAVAAMTDPTKQLVTLNGEILKMPAGLAVAKPSTTSAITIITDERGIGLTYVSTQTEMKYIESTENKVKVQLANTIGYVSHDNVTLIPDALKLGQSFYEVQGQDLIHHIYLPAGKYYVNYVYGRAPSFLKSGTKYYSWNGDTFHDATGKQVGTAYQYFNYLPVRTKTNYTAEDLNRFVANSKSTSPLKDLGAVFKKAEETYRINALYLLANAIHESNWGLSTIAKDKKNLFGIQAYDSDPYNSAKSFKTFEECIMFQAEKLSSSYVHPTGSYSNGAVSGNKSVGMNVKYASDPYWGQKLSGHMYRADVFLGLKDFGKYRIGTTTEAGLNVRKSASTSLSAQFTYRNAGLPVVIQEEVQGDLGTWVKTFSDSKDYETAYIFGEYVKELMIAK